MAEKAPWPDSTEAEDAAYALATQMIDMEFRGDVVRQGGPQLQGYVDTDRARLLGTSSYNLQGLYRPEDAESIMETGRYGPLADELTEKGIEPPGPDTVAVVGGENANEQVWAHEFGHRRDSMEGGGGERYRLIHDAFRSDNPFEWAAAVNRWYAYNERRYRKQGDINNYGQVEKDLKEAIASNTDSLIRTEVRAREAEGDIPIGREGMFSIESLDRDQREEMKRRSNSWSIEKYNTAIDKIESQGKASGGRVTMPSTSEKQSRFMRAVAHGWKPRHAKAPPVGVAQEFVAADQAVGMYEGGLAPMNDFTQRGFAPGLTGTAQSFQEGGEVENLSFRQLVKQLGGGIKGVFAVMRAVDAGEYFKNEDGTYYAAEPTILGADQYPIQEANMPVATQAQGQGPRGGQRGPRGGRRGGGGRRNGGGGGGGGGAPPEDNGGGGGGINTVPPLDDGTCPPGYRMGVRGNCRPEGGPGGGTPPPRIIPPEIPPGWTPPERREGRDTEYSDAIRQHKLRIAASLQVPPGGYAEGGAVRPGHAEDAAKGANPYDHGSARYNMWERKYHKDPPPPPEPEPEEEEVGWLASLLGKKSASETRTERELEEMEQAHGGYINGYANGGLAQFSRPPMGGVPPQVRGGMGPRRGGVPPRVKPQMDPRAMPPQGGGQGIMPGEMDPNPMGGGKPMPPGGDPRGMPPQPWRGRPPMPPRGMPPGGRGDPRGMPPQGGGRSGALAQMMRQAKGQRGRINPRGVPVPRGMPPDSGGAGRPGGPQLPPNLRGHLQTSRMMNRPRRGVPGPAGAGGQPNRVGMQDQQGGLARALQRGTGRPPTSRRSGFPGR